MYQPCEESTRPPLVISVDGKLLLKWSTSSGVFHDCSLSLFLFNLIVDIFLEITCSSSIGGQSRTKRFTYRQIMKWWQSINSLTIGMYDSFAHYLVGVHEIALINVWRLLVTLIIIVYNGVDAFTPNLPLDHEIQYSFTFTLTISFRTIFSMLTLFSSSILPHYLISPNM